MQHEQNGCERLQWVFLKSSGYRSACGPSYLKSYSPATFNVTVTHDEYAIDCPRLGRNVLHLNLTPKLYP